MAFISFSDYLNHFIDEITRADINFRANQTEFYNEHGLYYDPVGQIYIDELNFQFHLKKYKPGWLMKIILWFQGKGKQDIYILAGRDFCDFSIDVKLSRSSNNNDLKISDTAVIENINLKL